MEDWDLPDMLDTNRHPTTTEQTEHWNGDCEVEWKHPCDLSCGHAFLWTVPSQHVYLLNLFSYAIINMIHKASLALPLHALSRGFSFPHLPTPMPPLLICTQTQPGRGGLVEGGSSALSISLHPVEQLTSSRLLPCPP